MRTVPTRGTRTGSPVPLGSPSRCGTQPPHLRYRILEQGQLLRLVRPGCATMRHVRTPPKEGSNACAYMREEARVNSLVSCSSGKPELARHGAQRNATASSRVTTEILWRTVSVSSCFLVSGESRNPSAKERGDCKRVVQVATSVAEQLKTKTSAAQ